MARIMGRILSFIVLLVLVILIQMPLVIESINTISWSSGFTEKGLQIILMIWLVDSLLIALSFEWVSLTVSVIPFIITLPISLVYTTINSVYGWIVLTNLAVVIVLILARMMANVL
ncbi:MAG: hypothetical protein Q6366_007350 [Candidatus Freyarchaeota archaeon]